MPSIRDRVSLMPGRNLDAMQRDADAAIESLREAYLDTSRAAIAQLLARVAEPPPHDEAWRTEIYSLAHDLKGQGSTFGYELVTQIAMGLCGLIRTGAAEADSEFVKRAIAHCQALGVVLDKDIRGNGGDHGAALLKILSIGR